MNRQKCDASWRSIITARKSGQKRSPKVELESARRRYFELYDTAPVGCISFSQQGLILEANRMATRQLGVDPGALANQSLSQFVHPEDRSIFSLFLEQLFASAEPQACELRLLTGEGATSWSQLKAVATVGNDGLPLGRVVISDISQRKQLEETLRVQRDLSLALGEIDDVQQALELILDAALRLEPIDCGGIYLADLSGALHLVVQRGLSTQFVEQVSHYPADSMQSLLAHQGNALFCTYESIYSPLDPDGSAEGLRGLAILPVLHQGQWVALLNLASHTHDEFSTSTCQALETLAQQVGSRLLRLQADSALHESRRNLQTLFDTVGDFLFVVDGAGRILQTGATVRNRLGYSAAEMFGQNILMVHPPDQRSEAAAIVADMLAGRRDSCPIPLQTKEGELIPVETSVAVGQWSGKPALFCLSRDITRRVQAQAALCESEANLRALFNAPDESIFLVAADHTLLALNDIAAQRMGRPPEALIGGKLPDLLPPDVVARRRPWIDAALSTGGPVRFEDEREGRWMASRLHPILDADGRVVRLAVFSRDITATKEAEEELRQSESRFRAIIDVSPVPMGLNDELQNITLLNPAFVETFGYTLEDIPSLAHWWSQAYPDPEYRQWVVHTWAAELERAQETGSAFRPIEVSVRCKDGTNKTVLASAASLAASFQGSHLVVLHDISERKRAEEKLRDAHWRLESIIEGTHLGTWEWNVQTGETHFNEVWAQLIGYTLEELMPIGINTWKAFVHPDDLKQSGDLLERHFAGELPYYDLECRMRHKQGQWVWVHTRGRVITRSADGRPLMMFGTHADISARKHIEETLQTALTDIRTLRGILPICANCKAIRDDKGEWKPMEVYVSQHTQAEFTHGLCPPCIQKLYPEFAEEGDGSTAQI